MKESLLNDELFRHAFIVSLIIGVMCRGLVLRITDKQYPTRPRLFRANNNIWTFSIIRGYSFTSAYR